MILIIYIVGNPNLEYLTKEKEVTMWAFHLIGLSLWILYNKTKLNDNYVLTREKNDVF